MPRKSLYSVFLSAKERIELERISKKYTPLYYFVVRAKIALMSAAGLDNKTLAERLSLPRQIVSNSNKKLPAFWICIKAFGKALR